ncbi:hypothetical protein H8S33_18220 [Ornithinibacillus sp. BX22]|uniref:Uncharacterized protein n=1 Tax=Ornithinibacillus hominis TaxID=2763055 RepID=A0A923L998_9BACI|nr:hypothetical protein [Ornithinibacillus hominis]MBC5638711.1 hypothetical protein [Ornithinibacillus hominis]
MKKMFFYQKGWLWVSLYFIFSFAFLFFFDSPKNPELEMNNSAYQYYLDLVNGSHTNETEQLFRNEANKISEAQVELTKIYDDYYDGHISEIIASVLSIYFGLFEVLFTRPAWVYAFYRIFQRK